MRLKQKRNKSKFAKLPPDDGSESEEKTSGSEYDPPDSSIVDSESSFSTDLDLESNQDTTSKKRKLCSTQSDHAVASTSSAKKRKRCSRSPSSSELSSDDDLLEGKAIKKQKVQQLLESSTANSSLDLSINIESVGPVLRNKNNEVVKSSDTGTKKNVCYYCVRDKIKSKDTDKKVHFAKLVDHYESAHANETEIKKLIKIPKTKILKGKPKTDNQKKREKILEELRNKGNYLNNRVANDVSEYVVSRRPQVNRKNVVANYGTCKKCKKQLSLSSLRKHVTKCTGLSFKHKHAVNSSSRATTGDYSPLANEEAIKIISVIREDDILDEIRYDDAVFYWLNAEANKHETTGHHHNKIRANLRRLGRLKLEMRILNDKIEELSDIFHEDLYDDFIEACKILGKADPVTKFMGAASTANDMCYLIKSVANIYHVMIGKDQKEKREEVDAFLKKVTTMWHSSIGNTIAETQAKNRRNKVVKLPTQDDMVLLREFLEREMLAAYNALRIRYKPEVYEKLRNSIESYLHITNCRRAGEVEKLSLEDFNSRQIIGQDCRIQVRGKRTKPVPIIFDQTILKYLQLLIKNRHNAGIFQNNPYIFSTIGDVSTQFTFVSACSLMHKFSELCGAKDPETLRGTLFRKQVATTGMEKGIDNQEVEKLSNFLGHTPRIHIQNYRQAVFQRDVAVSRLVKEAQTSKTPALNATTPKDDDDSEQNDKSNHSIGPNESGDQELHESIEQDKDENNQNASNCSIASDASYNCVMVVSQQTELNLQLHTKRQSKIQSTEFYQSWKRITLYHWKER